MRTSAKQLAQITAGAGLLTALVLQAAPAAPAFAADTVTQAVTAGARTASVANATMSSSTSAHTIQTATGSMTLTADDSSGSGAGWNVTILSSDFAYTAGGNGGSAIPASGFALTSSALPAMTAGQAVNVTATNGPEASASSGTLDSARKVILAGPGYGVGTYTQALGVSLSVPADSRVGTYTGTLTTTITAAP